MTLSPEQKAAAHAGPDGAFLIAAGPGTGKTFTATERFCWLVERGVAPDRILTVTFNDRAAEELRQRITRELNERRPQLGPEVLDAAWIGTFHGTCARLLDEFAYLVGAPRELRVLDETGQRLFEQRMIARLRSGAAAPLDPDSFNALSVEDLDDLLRSGLRFLLKLKGRGITPDRFRARAVELHGRHWDASFNGASASDAAHAELEAIEVLFLVYRTYEDALHAEGLRDFDDLILEVIDALERVPEFRRRCRERFRYLLVDEFQDTNRIQLDLIRLLAADNFGNVSAVGDAKQSIYGWRDAEIENIRTRFPGHRLPLTHNRRSYQQILDCATDFIRRDPDFASEPDLVATRGSGHRPVTVVMAPDSRTEARSVAETIRRLNVGGRAFSDIAILAHSIRMLPREFEDELRRQGIPYLTSGGSGFFDRQEIKDVLALLRLTENPMDDGALVRMLQGPIVRLSDRGMYRLAARRFGRAGMRLRDCFEESGREGFPEMDPKVAAQAMRLIELTDRLGGLRDALTVADILNRLLEETGYLRWAELRAQRDGSPRALLNLRKVFQLASRFERDLALAGVGDFVRHLDQVIDAELPVGEAAEESATTDAVSLLTVHSAKGLEFPVVFLVNLRPPRPRDTERLFFDPDNLGFVMKNWRGEKHPRFKETSPGAPAVAQAMGERRRIVYVGLTRTKDALYVTATREEQSPRDVELGANGEVDHFAESSAGRLRTPNLHQSWRRSSSSCRLSASRTAQWRMAPRSWRRCSTGGSRFGRAAWPWSPRQTGTSSSASRSFTTSRSARCDTGSARCGGYRLRQTKCCRASSAHQAPASSAPRFMRRWPRGIRQEASCWTSTGVPRRDERCSSGTSSIRWPRRPRWAWSWSSTCASARRGCVASSTGSARWRAEPRSSTTRPTPTWMRG